LKFEPSASYRLRRQHSITEDLMDVVTSFAVTVTEKDMLQLVV
jgi:hypothetical protein